MPETETVCVLLLHPATVSVTLAFAGIVGKSLICDFVCVCDSGVLASLSRESFP